MALFTLSDLHLSLSADKPMDVFHGWDNYVERIDSNWRRIVTDSDTVVIPGDVSWAMHLDDAARDFQFLNALPGDKIILKGNHDLWWATMAKLNGFITEHGFDRIKFINNSAIRVGDYAVCGSRGWLLEESGTDSKLINREVCRLTASLKEGQKLGGEPVVFLHYPVIYEGQVCEELMSVLTEFGVKKVYYGHLHGASRTHAFSGEYRGIDFKLVSCDCVDFTPVLVR